MRQTYRKLGQMVQAGAYSSSDQQQVMDALRDIATRRTARRRTKLASYPYRLEVDLQYLIIIEESGRKQSDSDTTENTRSRLKALILDIPRIEKMGKIEKLRIDNESDVVRYMKINDRARQLLTTTQNFHVRGVLAFSSLLDLAVVADHLWRYSFSFNNGGAYFLTPNMNSTIHQYVNEYNHRSATPIEPRSRLIVSFRDTPVFSLEDYPYETFPGRSISPAINAGMIQYIVSKMDESLTTGSTTGTDKKRSLRQSTQITTTRPT